MSTEKREPKVLFVTRKYPPKKGGMEAYSYNLITNYSGPHKAITLGKSQKHLFWFLPYCCLYALFNARKYDVIELGDMLISAVGWVARKVNPKIKVVATIHGLDITFPNPLYQWYLKHFSYGFDLYVPNSTYTGDVAGKAGYDPRTMVPPATLNGENTLFPPKDHARFCSRHGLSEDSIVLFTAGRLVRRKGAEWFVRNVMPLLQDPRLVYLIAGEGAMRPEIEKAIADAGETRVQLLGRVSDEELKDLYNNADIFLMPNILVPNDVEGYGMVAVEAAAAGTLVVAANIQGILDAVTDGKNGVLYEAEKPERLKEVLQTYLDDPGAYEEVRSGARNYVMGHCTGEAIAGTYKRLIEELVLS